VSVETVADLLPACPRSGRLVDHDNIETGKQILLLTKRLSNNSLYTAPSRGVATMLLGDRQAQPGNARVIASAQHGKQFIPAACRFIEYAAECGSIKEPVVFGKPVARAARQYWVVARRRDGRVTGYGVN
jgi:hypothetical protein